LTPDKVELFDQNLAALLQTKYPTPILHAHHQVCVAIASLLHERLRQRHVQRSLLPRKGTLAVGIAKAPQS
ncbi:MAG: hypothetical protein ACYT04_84700, partial [Nostoc sp.]